MMFIYSILLLVISVQFTEGLVECMSCKRVAEPHDCKETTVCASHEQCYTDFYITPQGHVFYDLGCQSNRVCDALNQFGKRQVSKRQDENLYICQECCNSGRCNEYGCGDQNKLNRTICYSCNDVEHPSKCDTVSVCDIDKECYTKHFINDMLNERYEMGCEHKSICKTMTGRESNIAGHPKSKKQVIGGFDSIDLCYYCCDNSFCNHKECQNGRLTTHAPVTTRRPTTQKPTTTTPKPTTHKPTTTTHKPRTHKPTTHSPTTHKPRTHKPTTHSPTTHKPRTHKPTTHRPTTHKPRTHKPTTHRPTTHKPRTHKPTTHRPTTHKPRTHKPTTHKPVTHRPTTHKPTTHKPTTHKPTTHKPTTHKPTTHKPTTHKPTTTTRRPTTPTTKPVPFSCYHCEYISHERECNYTEICQQGHNHCYMARVDGGPDNDNLCFYKMGCMANTDCRHYKQAIHSTGTAVMAGSQDNIESFECCSHANCNLHTIRQHPTKCNPLTTIKP